MKRNRILLLLAAALLLLVCAACGPASDTPEPTYLRPTALPAGSPEPGEESPVPGSPAKGRELLATAHTQEDAEKIAELYGIELVEWSGHVAVYHTEEDPYEVIRRGEANGWPRLDINHVIVLDDGPIK